MKTNPYFITIAGRWKDKRDVEWTGESASGDGQKKKQKI